MAATPGEEALGAVVLGASASGKLVECAPQIVGDRKQPLGKPRDAVFLGVDALALGAAADVLGLGERAQ